MKKFNEARVNGGSNYDSLERDSHCPYLLSSETTAKGTGLAEYGPRSLTRARVGGSHESRRGAMKVKAGALAGRGGIPRPLQSAEGAPPARLARRAGEVEHERTC